MNFSPKIKEYAIKCHQDTNHLYDGYLPYQFHLNMVEANAHRFMPLIIKKELFRDGKLVDWDFDAHKLYHTIISACYCHDVIEDTRQNYSDICAVIQTVVGCGSGCGVPYKYQEAIAYQVADLVYAVSNEKGKNRKERENDKYFEGIKNTPYATFVKLCDRLANIQYSKMTAWKSDTKLEMYRKEDRHFVEQLYDEQYKEMFCYMRELFTEK